MNDATELLKERTSDAAGSALELLTKALSKSLYSERLLQMKAEALYLVFSILVICSTCLNVFLSCLLLLLKYLYNMADKSFCLFMVTTCSCKSMMQQFSFVNRV